MNGGSVSISEEQPFDLVDPRDYFSELSPQPMVAVEGPAHIVRYLNAAFLRLVGKKAEELIGQPFAEAIPEGEGNRSSALLNRVYSSGRAEILDEQEHSKSPPVYWSYAVWAITGTEKRPVGLVVQITDTTEIAIFRRESMAMNEQLLLSATRQHELTENAERANRLKDEFLAVLSHELRTPLTSILGWAGVLVNPNLDSATAKRGVQVIHRNALMQVQMIDDLLDHARIMTGKLTLNVQSVDLGQHIMAAVDGQRPAAEAKEIDLRLQLSCPGQQMSGDPDRLQQVFWNVISNAIKFTPKGGRVVVSLELVEAEIHLTVSDTGKGIAPEFLPHVFDRFRQADGSTTRAFTGLGLGLAIVRQLVELHGGTVRLDSAGEGLGSTCIVSLPLRAESANVGHTGHTPRTEVEGQEVECPQELNDLRVLVVDDAPDTCELLKLILERCGAQVKTAGSTDAAMEAMSEEAFDVLISDLGMPNGDGYSLIAKVRALSKERGGKIPAAALTAYAGEETRIRVLRSGYQIHVSKPISATELVAIVANLAGRTV